MLHLLPEYHKQKVTTEYRQRVLVVLGLGIILTTFVSGGFLVPAYISTYSKYSVVEDRRAQLELEIKRSENNDDASKVKDIVSTINVLKKYGLKEKPSDIFSRILEHKPQGVTISGFIYTPPADINDPINLTAVDISGVALNRTVLSQFSDALRKDKVFSTVYIPISSFAKEKNIGFTVKLTISKDKNNWAYTPVGNVVSQSSTTTAHKTETETATSTQ